ncbi:MAG: hypothetical protein MNSN_08250 [Minisyncoccus archaeiphilus]|uniref:hypothetical protein n=1 Tax=Minisyncoccus archaeiphilus TaxID=3238481 RepID=UPI002B1686FB|nr:MAG: hypothetical protein MNSN_08250 [Candidatus Parcubacteria bacterium]
MFIKYTVMIGGFAESHYIKKFDKKYGGHWVVTWRGVQEELTRIDSLLLTSIAEVVSEKGDQKIVKTEFRVAGTKDSRKASGNRCIVLLDDEKNTVVVLLVYNKNDLRDDNETVQWQKMIKENYKEYAYLI